MKRFLRVLAVLILIFTVAFWVTARKHPLSAPVSSSQVSERQFAPGTGFLAGNAILAVVIFGLSFIPKD